MINIRTIPKVTPVVAGISVTNLINKVDHSTMLNLNEFYYFSKLHKIII